MKDQIGQTIELGRVAVWTAYNRQWFGHVTKITEKCVWMTPVHHSPHVRAWRFRPHMDKVLLIDELPKAALFWSLTEKPAN